MEVYLIRHTTPLIEKGVCYGQSDIPLDETLFEEEYSLISSKIPEDIEVFYSSPLRRCAVLASRLTPHVLKDERLKELDFGDWELCKWNDLDQEELMQWMDDFVENKVPRGENYLDLHQRTTDFIADLPYDSHLKIAIVTHAGNIRSFISEVLGLPLQSSFRIGLSYGAVVQLSLNKDKHLNQLRFIR